MPSDSHARIRAVVERIPYGKVASYGQVARIAGLGKRARLVGYALHTAPEDQRLPWHRVINSRGRISFPAGSESYQRQRELLESEGVEFISGQIDMGQFRWQEGGDEWPPEYLEQERRENQKP